MNNKYLCIHGHFYQPPRENPWLEFVEYQASAQPYHDWNERITRECYGPNARARLHDQEGHIKKLCNNYERMSFNFGPTLLSWMEKAHPWIYDQILAADLASRDRYQGHGNALAQVYNHIIMPLARRRDKLTQIRWGLADFEQRFGRKAEGMWLAETAVDTETLDMMAQEGIKFTILSPTQAHSVRSLSGNSGKNDWQDVSGGQIDPTLPYRVWLDKGSQRFIDIFFYDGPLSRAVAYEKILESGKNFLSRIEQAFGEHKDGPRLVNVATDGESYGHHFKFGDLALSWIFDHLEQTGAIELTNYALYLERFPPQNDVKILEDSSWSCAHGIERWRSDCGCSIAQTPGWNQTWRAPLREGLDWLNSELGTIFEKQAGGLLKDPWEARDDYVTVFSNPSDLARERFLKCHAAHGLGATQKGETFQLMESQRMSLYMFTSCGWFFDDISGLEAVQVLKYAARAIDLAQPLTEKDLEGGLIGFLSKAMSNVPEYGDGNNVYHQLVKPSRTDPSRAAAHYGLAALANVTPDETGIFSERVHPVQQQELKTEGLNAILGEAQVAEKTTGRISQRAYIAFRQGIKTLSCFVGKSTAPLDLEQMGRELLPGLAAASSEKIEDVFLRHLHQVKRYELHDLIPDTRKCLIKGLAHTLHQQIKNSLMDSQTSLQEFMVFLEKAGEPLPESLEQDVQLLIREQLGEFMTPNPEKDPFDWDGLHRVAEQAKQLRLKLNGPELRKKTQNFLRNQMTQLVSAPDRNTLGDMIDFLNMAEIMHLELDLWECQNTFYDLYTDPDFTKILDPENAAIFDELGRRLGFLIGEKTDT